jgi:PAT family acetyl-CoA transporter-like MFS transporter 1
MSQRKGSAEPMAMSSSLNSIRITPRTPKTPRPAMHNEDDVELTLLAEEERLQSANGFRHEDSLVAESDIDSKKPISANDKRQMVLLCILCQLVCSLVLCVTADQSFKTFCKGFL